MSMFCFQCQEACGNTGCTVAGVCGKKEDTAQLQDLLIYTLKGIAIYAEKVEGDICNEVGDFIIDSLFATITNANFDSIDFTKRIEQGIAIKAKIQAEIGEVEGAAACATWSDSAENFAQVAKEVGVLATENEDVRSLRELLIYGLKGIAAYTHHAIVLGKRDETIVKGIVECLASITKDLSVPDMIGFVMKAGEISVSAMALLDTANTSTYGNPELSTVNIGVGNKPGILISGHDLSDIKQLLDQTKGTGIDVYTHSEMLPAHYYPELKKYDNLVGNYGNAWYKQGTEFASFNGPILMTTNCITPVKKAYQDRIFTTGVVEYPGVKHITADANGKKDFSEIIELAKGTAIPTEIETGSIVGGFAHEQVFALADKVIDAVKSGAVKKFIVMAGCDGRQKGREYYTDFAKSIPEDTIILTAGCAKYRYNKLELGDIGGIPRVLDAGQCNDSYSLALIALKLKEVFELEDINDLPIVYNIAWYEQKAVTVLLALLHLGVKNIHLGPTLPAFLSPTVAGVLVDTFGIGGITTVDEDIKSMIG